MTNLSPPIKKIMIKLHRWGGLLLAAFILFYCITGVLLNHRQQFDFFQSKQQQTTAIAVSGIEPLLSFIATYKQQINRKDDPTVIRIKNGSTIEFLYGSHGKTTYIIEPKNGLMHIVNKEPVNPWHWLNRLHKAFRTSPLWLVLTDVAAILIMLTTITGLFILRYRLVDIALAGAGLVLLIAGALLAC